MSTVPARSGRRVRGALVIVLTVGALLILATRLVPHPVGAARTFDKYEGKAATTAKSALSKVATVRLAAQAGGRDRAFGPYLSILISDGEESIRGVQGTFDAIQPPDERADAIAHQLDQLLSDAVDHVREVRVAVRRGELAELEQTAAPLTTDVAKLRAFGQQHG